MSHDDVISVRPLTSPAWSTRQQSKRRSVKFQARLLKLAKSIDDDDIILSNDDVIEEKVLGTVSCACVAVEETCADDAAVESELNEVAYDDVTISHDGVITPDSAYIS